MIVCLLSPHRGLGLQGSNFRGLMGSSEDGFRQFGEDQNKILPIGLVIQFFLFWGGGGGGGGGAIPCMSKPPSCILVGLNGLCSNFCLLLFTFNIHLLFYCKYFFTNYTC